METINKKESTNQSYTTLIVIKQKYKSQPKSYKETK